MVKSPVTARFTFLCSILTIPLALITHIWTRLLNPCLQLRYFPSASLLANPTPLTSKQMQVAFAPGGFGLCAKLDFVLHTPMYPALWHLSHQSQSCKYMFNHSVSLGYNVLKGETLSPELTVLSLGPLKYCEFNLY